MPVTDLVIPRAKLREFVEEALDRAQAINGTDVDSLRKQIEKTKGVDFADTCVRYGCPMKQIGIHPGTDPRGERAARKAIINFTVVFDDLMMDYFKIEDHTIGQGYFAYVI